MTANGTTTRDLSIVLLAHGQRKYLDEAVETIAWHRARGLRNPIELWIDPAFGSVQADAAVRELPVKIANVPAYVLAWYFKTWVLRATVESRSEPFAFLDSYARVLDPASFNAAGDLARKFEVCLSLDPRRILGRDLRSALGTNPELLQSVADIPTSFPLWNTGVIFVGPGPKSQALLARLEELSRGYLDRGITFREQITLVQAVYETAITPLTLPDSYNIRRPFVEPAIVLHSRRYAHFYGVPEIDRPVQAFERTRHRMKAFLYRLFGLETMS